MNYGAEVTLANHPCEVGLGRLVDLDKVPPFIGQEVLKRIKAGEIKHKLVRTEIQGEPLEFNMTRWPIRQGTKTVGEVTSAIYSPRLNKKIGYGMMPLECAKLGTLLTVEVSDSGDRSAAVVQKPFIDPQNDIPRS